MKTLAIFGASGFIGRSLCDRLSQSKERLLLTSLSGGKHGNLNIEPLDLQNKDAVRKWFRRSKVDVLFYLSSLLPSQHCENDLDLLNSNLRIHENIFECWLQGKFHLIYASGTSVYAPSLRSRNEESLTMPQSFYTVSKLWGEHIFNLGVHDHKLPLTILRISAPFGLKEKNKTVVNVFFENAMKGLNLELYGTGQRQQDFIYVRDVAQSFYLAYHKRKNGVFNIASGKSLTMKMLAQAVINETGSKSKIIFNGQLDLQESFRIKVDISKVQNELGFYPKYSLEDGIRDMRDAINRKFR